MKKIIFTALISIFVYSYSFSQVPLSDTGLEIIDHENVFVLVEAVGEDARRIGLSSNRIESRVKIRLRQVGLRPVESYERRDASYLYVNINIIGTAFSINLSFIRDVFFYEDSEVSVGTEGLYKSRATTWRDGGTGTHANNPEYIISSLDGYLDQFLSDYLDAND